MSVSDSRQTREAPTVAPPPVEYETCEQCEAPVEATQRYCVVCGTHRRHVHDPAARFLAEASSRSRSATRIVGGPVRPRRRSPGLGLALALAVIPLAVAVGALIAGRGNDSNSKLLAALRAQKPTVVNVNGGGASGATTATSNAGAGPRATPVARLTSNFGLQQGYAVELQTLPGSGTSQATVSAAERRARDHGATAVGLISQSDFQVTPAPPTGDYVIYSGQYHSRRDATAALGKLKRAFPAAKVIAVHAVGSSSKVIAKTSYGSAHEVSGFKPSAGQLSSGAKVANQVSKEINGQYVKSQQGLPDAISIP